MEQVKLSTFESDEQGRFMRRKNNMGFAYGSVKDALEGNLTLIDADNREIDEINWDAEPALFVPDEDLAL